MIKKERSHNILIVEDDQSSSAMLKGLLENSGYSVVDIVSSGEEAVRKALNWRPDIILMDISLRGAVDGIDACARIKEKADIPVIYLTINADDGIIQRAKKTMPYGYILKPYNKNMLTSTLEMAFYKIESEKKLKESEQRNQEILKAIPDRVFRLNQDGSFVSEEDSATARKVWSDKVTKKGLPHIQKMLETGSIQIFEYALQKDKHMDYYEARLSPSAGGKVLVMVRDVTYRKISEIELEKYRNSLEDIVSKRTGELSSLNQELQGEIDIRRTIERNLQIFSHAISQSPAVVAIINGEGQIEYVNAKCSQICGMEFNEMVGKKVSEEGSLVIPDPALWKEIKEQGSWKGEINILNARKEEVCVQAKISSIKDEEGRASHYVLIGDDITESKKERLELNRLQQAIQRKKNESEEVELDWQEWKEKMLSRNISRTDKSLFRNINNSFTQGAGFGTLITLLDLMHTSAEHRGEKHLVDTSLYELIIKNVRIAQDAFKTFSTIDWIISNDFSLEGASFYDLYQTIRAVVAKAGEFIGIKKQRIVMSEYSPVFSQFHVSINKEYFFTALYEIILNAMKFSKPQTTIAVLLYVMNNNVSLSVINEPEKTDEGFIGIPVEYEKVVFEPFYRMSKFVYEQYNTLDFGLGLTLVEKIITKHGGEVLAENILDHSDLKREPQTKVCITITFPTPME
ncbi:MAG TPA: response regulator [Spirochaetota bacterium]|nr:response regulator [Spirochaetota bacterium]